MKAARLTRCSRRGDAIHSLNGTPCCTIEDVRRALGSALELTFEVCRPRHAEIFASEAMVKTAEGSWAKVMLNLTSARVLEMAQDWRAVEQVQVRRAESVSIHPGRELRLGAADGFDIAFKTGSTADLERWHTLLTQMMMFQPGMRCDLTGWLQADSTADPRHAGAERQYFELYSNGTVLVYSSPHRNKLGQALLAVALSQCSVHMDPKEPGTWLIRDVDRDGAIWRCTSCQAVGRNESAESVLLAHALPA